MSKWVSGLDKLWDRYDDLLEAFPESRRIALEAAGKRLKEEVDRQIDKQLPNHDAGGRVKSWQEVTMGSRGGYVKVAPMDKKVSESKRKWWQWFRSTKKYSSRDITFWLERGHKMVLPRKAREGFYSSDREDYQFIQNDSTGAMVVRAHLFYSWAGMDAQKLAYEAAEEVLYQLSEDLVDLVADYVEANY